MAGYQTIEALRPILHRGPPVAPVVDRALVRPAKAFEPKCGRPIPEDWVAEIVARRRAGESAYRIAKSYGISHMTVLRKTKHVEPPPGGWADGWANGARERKLFRIAFAERLYRSGFSYAEIAAEVGCHKSTVYRHFVGRKHPGGRLLFSEITRRVVEVARVKTAEVRQCDRPCVGRRPDDIARVRAVLFWLLRRRLKLSYAEIGQRLGGFDKHSVRHSVARVDQTLDATGIPDTLSIGRFTRTLLSAEWPKASA